MFAALGCEGETRLLDGNDAPRDGGARSSDPTPEVQVGWLTESRVGMTATYLPAHDLVLVLGGRTVEDTVYAHPRMMELIDPNTTRSTAGGELSVGQARSDHTATVLDDERVVVLGGRLTLNGTPTPIRTGFVADATDAPEVRTQSGFALIQPRASHGAVRLPDGKIFVAGGAAEDTPAAVPDGHVSIFDPVIGRSEVIATLERPRYAPSVTLSRSGAVFVAGGYDLDGPVRTVEVFVAGAHAGAFMLPASFGAIDHRAAPFGEGVILTGGYVARDATTPTDRAFVLDSSGALVEEWGLRTPRAEHGIIATDDIVLLVGGAGPDGDLDSTEWITSTELVDGPRLQAARRRPVAVPARDRIVVIGGIASEGPYGRTVQNIEAFDVYAP